ncbi:TRAP transporter small permease subunit [Paenalcaligenes niemegkensis]|uniref:TRAP transporter small permease subunit n=1 Tax=Paenalcaligenes niemegkensis TaxID=2895469 RepID=UPI001EE86E3B|nr:TRAP transporter small permease subunit [Paenalcaligenes niemegkensis]MCQ9617454.1 TRAP transporter small permease subunit [Paenalcaligenes niemegkensis]
MIALKFMVGGVDRLNRYIGAIIKWLLLVATILSAGNAITRKAFDISSNGMLEAQWYLYAAVFLLGGAYCFQCNGHVRIDFISNRLTAKGRNVVDIFGIGFILLPFCIFMISLSWGFFSNAWATNEMSGNAGGLIRWPAYLLIPSGFFLLLLQAVAELIKRVLFLAGKMDDPISDDQQGATPIEVPQEAHADPRDGRAER